MLEKEPSTELITEEGQQDLKKDVSTQDEDKKKEVRGMHL